MLAQIYTHGCDIYIISTIILIIYQTVIDDRYSEGIVVLNLYCCVAVWPNPHALC